MAHVVIDKDMVPISTSSPFPRLITSSPGTASDSIMTASEQTEKSRDLPGTSPTPHDRHSQLRLGSPDVAYQSSTEYCWEPSNGSRASGRATRRSEEFTPRSVSDNDHYGQELFKMISLSPLEQSRTVEASRPSHSSRNLHSHSKTTDLHDVIDIPIRNRKATASPTHPPPSEPPMLHKLLEDKSLGAADLSDFDDIEEGEASDFELEHKHLCATCNGRDLEADVLRDTGYDFNLADRLIPRLHALMDTGCRMTLPDDGNDIEVSQCALDSSGKGSDGFVSNETSGGSADSGDQRDRLGGNTAGGNTDKQEPNEQGNGGKRKRKRKNSDDDEGKQFACPFNKFNPGKYNGRKGTIYRACNGPGFKEFRFLRDHLERIHTHVQCDRCSTIIKGSENERKKQLLEDTHHRLGRCQDNQPETREGIGSMQWENIKQVFASKKPKMDMEKWKRIWSILFPLDEQPHPWYEPSSQVNSTSTSFTDANRAFEVCFYKIRIDKLPQDAHNNILPGGAQDSNELRAFIKEFALETFQLWYSHEARSGLSTSMNSKAEPQIAEPLIPINSLDSSVPAQFEALPFNKPGAYNRPSAQRIVSSPARFPDTVITQPPMQYDEQGRHGRSLSTPPSNLPQQVGVGLNYNSQEPSNIFTAPSNQAIGPGHNNVRLETPYVNDSDVAESFYSYEQPGTSSISTVPHNTKHFVNCGDRAPAMGNDASSIDNFTLDRPMAQSQSSYGYDRQIDPQRISPLLNNLCVEDGQFLPPTTSYTVSDFQAPENGSVQDSLSATQQHIPDTSPASHAEGSASQANDSYTGYNGYWKPMQYQDPRNF